MLNRTVVLLFLLVLASPVVRGDDRKDILQQQKELEDIKKEVSRGRQKVDSLKQVEMSLQKKLSDSDQKISTNKKVITRLNSELDQLKKKIKSTEEMLGTRQVELDLSRRRYLGNVRQFYLTAHQQPDIFSENPNQELNISRQILYLTALAGYESAHVQTAAALLKETVENKDDLAGEQKKISQMKKTKESSTQLAVSQKTKQEKNLDQIRRRKTEEADRVVMLEQAAREMEQIIARLQEEIDRRRREDGRKETGSSVFASLKGNLASPYRGKITNGFGEKVDQITNLKSFSAGISIQGNAGQAVVAVASGTVAYVGSLRGYGNFIIINHDDRYFTTYAGLGDMFVTSNQYVPDGYKLAVSDNTGIVRFELREERRPLDPVEWIKIDAF